jgi:hypothetical protein
MPQIAMHLSVGQALHCVHHTLGLHYIAMCVTKVVLATHCHAYISCKHVLYMPWSGPYQTACLVAGWSEVGVGGVVQVGGTTLPKLVAGLAQISITAR